ncbi:MAG: phage portal protein [Phenylobacterium zucineum]|nr:MAG: phage portal protein [Phenylobacterium zucineum]
MSQVFSNALAKAKVPGSVVLNAWRQNFGPEAAKSVQNMNQVRENLTVDELLKTIGAGFGSSSGALVSEATAMKVSAVYACVALVAGAISTLPLNVYQRTDTGREKAKNHQYWWFLNEQPDDEISAAVFWEYIISAKMFYGDGYAEILRPHTSSTEVSGLRLHHPLRVYPFRDVNGRLWYRVTPLVGASYVLQPADMLHIPSLGYDGLTSPSPITYAARQAVGTSIATAEWNGKFFSNGARPDFALETPGNLTKEQVDVLRATWMDAYGGSANSHKPAILTGGLKATPLTLSQADSQILQTASWNLEEICRVLGVPPFMVGSTEKTTSWGTGQENMGKGFVKYTLRRDLIKIQQEINRKFWPRSQKFFVEFDVTEIERGDLKTENEAFRVALGRAGEPGWLTVNEVRSMKLLAPVDGGDEINKAVPTADPNAAPADPAPADPKKKGKSA